MRGRPKRADAVDALVSAVRSLGLDAWPRAERDSAYDLLIRLPDDRTVEVEIKSVALVTADTVLGQLRRWSGGPESNATQLVVADRITADGREKLDRAGWSWLDLRGHLKLSGSGLFVDADVPTTAESEPVRQGVIGQVGIELAALLLLDPGRRIGVRAAATVLQRAPSSVSAAFAALRAANLIDLKSAPTVPELFWELAEHWKPVSHDVASIPGPGGSRDTSVLGLGLDDVESTVGWALTHTIAAVRYGAPVSLRADHPPDFYVPDRSTLHRAVRLLGTASASSARAGRVRMAPVPLVCARRVDGTTWTDEPWPLANPLFVALDLAGDPGRGREILDTWTPGGPWHRVW